MRTNLPFGNGVVFRSQMEGRSANRPPGGGSFRLGQSSLMLASASGPDEDCRATKGPDVARSQSDGIQEGIAGCRGPKRGVGDSDVRNDVERQRPDPRTTC